ncbi:hypothetical protein PPERSA_03557 [Pseudocohnilembus persalinus]|uniref:Transmembrane protein n=1 Tax=Pseudocohnilembus persalinus TaxID=266149 RepID=A0A0V0QQ41_PSEPJ|nr:hypothetical protein PPERSA_03557 [Pseudocohnilembus persalinus]|eukprot:KRX04317.1 hypothetical protein PPERSA_03557 [Pseudocohnilembus persalinus]
MINFIYLFVIPLLIDIAINKHINYDIFKMNLTIKFHKILLPIKQIKIYYYILIKKNQTQKLFLLYKKWFLLIIQIYQCFNYYSINKSLQKIINQFTIYIYLQNLQLNQIYIKILNYNFYRIIILIYTYL